MTARADSSLFQRTVTDDDLDLLTTLLDACTKAHLDRSTSREEVLERLGTPGCDPETDASIVVEPGGTAVGFANVWSAPPDEVRGFARVHPDWRRHTVGSHLAGWMLRRAREKAADLDAHEVRFTTTAWGRDDAAAPVLDGAGLTPVRHFLHMHRALGPQDDARPEPPAGVTVRTYVEGADDDALFACFAAAFADHWGQATPDANRWWWDERDSPDSGYDPSLWLLAEGDAGLLGFVLGRVTGEGTAGYVSQIGVAPPGRGRGLGRMLLDLILHEFRVRGLASAGLDVDVDNTTSALRLYRGAGMTERPAFTIWGRTLG